MPSEPHISAWAALQARNDASRTGVNSIARPRPAPRDLRGAPSYHQRRPTPNHRQAPRTTPLEKGWNNYHDNRQERSRRGRDGGYNRHVQHSRHIGKSPRRYPQRRAESASRQQSPAFAQRSGGATPRSTRIRKGSKKIGSGLVHGWVNNGVVRVAVGVVATVVLVLSVQRTIETPEEIIEAPQMSAQEGQALDIVPSPALEMYVPAAGIHANFDVGSCRIKDGAIDPENMDTACTYTADDRPYSLPGTNAEDLVVIAGHTGAGVAGVFDNLYDGGKDEHQVRVGDKLYLRTEASGDDWLVYVATDLHDPDKGGLANDVTIWGDGPQPGRLLTISCIQPANLWQPAVRNAVVGWQLESVASPRDGSNVPDQASSGEV